MLNQFSSLKRYAFVTGALLCVGCANLSTESDIQQAANASLPQIPDNWQTAQIPGDFSSAFVESFKDPILNGLIKEALQNNNNLLASAANVDKANALAKQAGASIKPMANLAFSSSRTGGFNSESSSETSLNTSLQVQWELDLWGRVRAGAKAAYASFESVQADYEYARHSIAANVAKTYFIALEAKHQEELLAKTLANLVRTEKIVNVQYKNGLASAQDLSLVKSDLATVQEQVEALKGSKRQALRALEVLLGRYPSADLKLANELPNLPPLPKAGIPSEILERRPDVFASERRVAASFNSLDQAKAAQLPTVSLSNTIGGASSSLSDLLKTDNLVWQLASNLVSPLFDGGLRQAQIDAANAEQKAAIASYAQTALTAFSEVENSLDAGVELQNRVTFLKEAEQESNKALNIAQLRYKAGESDLLDVLSIQQRVTSAESGVVSVYRLLLEQRVNLHLALGGNW